MSRKRGRIRGLYIVGILWLIFSRVGIGVTGLLSFVLLFGISLSVIVALARASQSKESKNNSQITVDRRLEREEEVVARTEITVLVAALHTVAQNMGL